MQPEYARHYRSLWERHWWWRSREAFLLDRLRRLQADEGGRPLRTLDVGCGDGLFFAALARFGPVDGLEPDASLIVDPRHRDRIHVAPLETAVLPDSSYDLVLMLDVLEHIADDREALLNARRALRPGGRILLTVPALSWLWSRHDERNEHHRRYDRDGLARLLASAGYEVEDAHYFFAWTVAPLLVRRWLTPAAGPNGKRLAVDPGVAIPPAPINRVLTLASRAEHALGRLVRWPLGSSLLAVARASKAYRRAESSL